MEIIQLGAEYLEEVYELSNQLENEQLDYEGFKRCYFEIMSLSNHLLYGVKKERLIGFIHLRVEQQLHHASLVVEILELVIDDKHRSQKYGKRLLDFAVNYSKSIQASHIELSSNQFRRRAHQFYNREGFIETSVKFVKKL